MKDELIERLEAAEGLSRELDRDIADFIGEGPPSNWQRRPREHDGCINADAGSWISPGGSRIKHSKLYTTCINAALTLVPEGWRMELQTWPCGESTCRLNEWSPPCRKTSNIIAKTPALAICIAALRAIEEGEG